MDFFSEIIGETVILGLDSLILAICIKQLNKCKHIMSSLQSAPVLDIDATLDTELCKYPNNTIPFVVVRGLVKSLGNPITSNYKTGITGVIQRLTIKEHVIARTSAGFWSDQTRTIHEAFNAIPFMLCSDKFKIEVVDALSADLLDMDVISDKFEPMSPGVIDHVWGFFSGVRQRGLQTMEEMLREDACITVIGELSKSSTDEAGSSVLRIQPPKDGLPLYLTNSTKSSLLKRLGSSKDFLRILLVVFGSVAVAASLRIVYKFIKRRRRRSAEADVKRQLENNRRVRRANARPGAKSLAIGIVSGLGLGQGGSGQGGTGHGETGHGSGHEASGSGLRIGHGPGDEMDDYNQSMMHMCVVCTENPTEIILLPCGHVCLCEDCADNINDLCPICREKIVTKSPAFIV